MHVEVRWTSSQKMKRTNDIETSSSKGDIRNEIWLNQSQQTSSNSIEDLCRQQVYFSGIFEQNNQGTTNGQTQETRHEKRFAAYTRVCHAITNPSGDSHGDLSRDNGSGNERNGRSLGGAIVVVASHEFAQNEQNIGIGKAVVEQVRRG